jgi:hypothetical protein
MNEFIYDQSFKIQLKIRAIYTRMHDQINQDC